MSIYQLKQGIKYYCKAQTRYTLHSPFLFEFTEKALRGKQEHPLFSKIESLRKDLLSSNQVIHVNDLGAGSHTNSSSERAVKDIAKASLKPERYAQLLYRIAHYFQPDTTLELGSSLGLTTLYLAAGNEKGKVITLEGADEIAAIAQNNFNSCRIKNIELVKGNFDDTLQAVLLKTPPIDLVYFDGNHRLEPTLRYFHQCLEKAHNNSVFIFDDIHWSPDMTRAWEQIKKHPSVTVTIDIFQFGLAFFRNEQAKQDFILRF